MIGLIVRSDKSGLGIQTERLARMLNPDKVLLINSTSFNGNKQYPLKYAKYNTMEIYGFPNDLDMKVFLSGLTKVITCETFYSPRFTPMAKAMGVETICIANPEFFDWFKPTYDNIPVPDKVVVPSHWMLDVMSERFGAKYIPTPIFDDEFRKVRESNMADNNRGFSNYLFMNGKTAAEDRNGLEVLYKAVRLAKTNFRVTVKAQNSVPKIEDRRVMYDFSNPDDQADLYKGYDMLIQPRRYAGQSLSMCEALFCGIPVVMTDIDPNNKVLPKKWLLPSEKTGELMTRLPIDVYTADPQQLADILDKGVTAEDKQEAYDIGKHYDSDYLVKEYMELIA